VIGIDLDSAKVQMINQGQPPVTEPDLPELIKGVVEQGLLTATTDFSQLNGCELILITVGTPIINGKADLSALISASESIAQNVKSSAIVVVKSTVPPGTTRNVIAQILSSDNFSVGFVPERLAEGQAISEFRNLPMVVGGVDRDASDKIVKIWGFLGFEVIKVVDSTAAEMVKLADNAWIDLNIAFGHELAQICDAIKTDVLEVIRAANTLKKGSSFVNILIPSVGVGGYCLTKDPYFLNDFANSVGVKVKLSVEGRKVNENSPRYLLDRLSERRSLTPEVKILALGIAFKNNSGDIRFSPAVDFVRSIMELGLDISWYDPLVLERDVPQDLSRKRIFDLDEAKYDVIACLANHEENTDLNVSQIVELLSMDGLIIDGRRFFSQDEISYFLSTGRDYLGIGRGY
jgi:UDP-N-acetyl-D-mannosaminuronic acid dehydrogenase